MEQFHNVLNAGGWKRDDQEPFIQCCCNCIDNGYLYGAGVSNGILSIYEFRSSTNYSLFAQTQLNPLNGETEGDNLSVFDRVVDMIYNYDSKDGGQTIYIALGTNDYGIAIIQYRTYNNYFNLLDINMYADFKDDNNYSMVFVNLHTEGEYGAELSDRDGIGYTYFDVVNQVTVRDTLGHGIISSFGTKCARAFDGVYRALYACYNKSDNTCYIYAGASSYYAAYASEVLGCTINVIQPGVYYIIYKRLDQYSNDVQIVKITPSTSSSTFKNTVIKSMNGLGCRAHKIIKDSGKYYLLGMGDVSYIWEILNIDTFTLGDPVELPYLAGAYNTKDDAFIDNFGLYYLFENYNTPYSYRPSLPTYDCEYNVFMKIKN